ncbi:MAG: SusF/SusE family outer membrane protein [Bacteroidales bacterium]|nr:SusF/SusE family outer membrane protein [Bacteroidales bacterium]HRW20806.1 SusF/SusE family outer membrane protein [Bacteroidales bacterium]
MRTSKFNLAWLLFIAIFTFASCNKDDDGGSNPILVEDGMYVIGDATPWADFSLNAQMIGGINEVDGSARTSMYEKYTTLEAGKEFRIVEVAGKETIDYGPDQLIDFNTYGKYDQPNITCKWGSYKVGGTYTVSTSGLYHIVIDKELSRVAIIPVNYWAILGGATANGWSDSKMELNGSFDKNTMSFKATDLVLRAGDFKFRYSGGWKLGIDDSLSTATVKVNTNFGGATDALVPGGDNITFDGANEGAYTVEMTWSSETSGYGYTATLTKTGDVEPLPEYPEAMYIVGDATAYGWDAPGTYENAIMHKCAGGTPTEGLYWKICYIESGKGFKLAAANWSDPNLGFGDVTSYDSEGVTVSDASGNMSIAESGMYMVVLDLRNSQTLVSVKPAEVYGIGDAFGDWTTGVEANKFTVDNTAKTLISPALGADGNIRMYAAHSWIPDWWNAEFRVNGTAIEYRNDGGDLDAVAGTQGQVITLHFDDNTGSIAK